MNKYRLAYHQHKSNARMHEKEFLLTFDEWLQIWEESGNLHNRGRGKNKYCMARFGDKGPYKVGNVKIITNGENISERVITEAYRIGCSQRMQGNTHKLGKKESLKTRKKKSLAKIGNQYTRGYKHSEATKKKWSNIRKQWWKEQRCPS